MKRILLSLILLTGCFANTTNNKNSSIIIINEEKKLVSRYIDSIRRCYQWEYYAYTYQKLEGKYNTSGTKNHYLITVYTENERIEFICWESIIDFEIEWEKI